MGDGRSGWRAAMWGAACGMFGGLVATCLYYLYEQLTRPNPYNVLTFVELGPVLIVLGGVVGLLAAVWYSSD